MFIKKISIVNFRNYGKLSINLKKGITIIYGNNAQGKTNLLESIYLLAFTKSYRSFIDSDLIKKGEKFSIVSGSVEKNNVLTKYKLIIEDKKKTLQIEESKIKKISDYISNINIIIFYPEDLEIIKGSPEKRRRYLNMEISQLNNNYYKILLDYNKLLKMRNDYIKLINSNKSYDNSYFTILTGYLIEKSILIYNIRKKFIEKINLISERIFFNLSGIGGFNIKYITSIKLDDYDNEQLRNIIASKMNENYYADLKYKSTLLGPHRDDLEFYIGNDNIKTYGSQGQQRMAILALKLAEIELFKKNTGNFPILLLDDVFSELDETKRNNLLSYIHDEMQVIITTTDLNSIEKSIIKKSTIIEVNNGNVEIKKEVD